MGAADAADAAEAHGYVNVVVHDAGSEVRLAHPLYGDALGAGLSAAHRRELYRRLADALDVGATASADDVLRVATWRLESGTAADPALLVVAARAAVARCDQILAERLARAAVARGGGHEALAELGEALYWQTRYEEADAVLALGESDDADPADRAQCAIRRASTRFWGLDQAAAADAGLRTAESALAGRPERAEVARAPRAADGAAR